jgi:diacylglycerol kinase (ATP)
MAERGDAGRDPRARRRAFVVGRQRRGRSNGKVIRDVERELRAAGWKADSALVHRKRDIRKAASRARRRCDVVVAVGGDGAVLQVGTALAGTGVALGIVPTGTGNLLATNLRIPDRPADAIKTILDGRRRVIDLGQARVDGRRRDFAVACGIGFDADVMEATDPGQKVRWGRLAYAANAIRTAGSLENVTHEIELDGEVTRIDAAQVFIANFGGVLPSLRPRQPIPPDDGYFDVIVVRADGPLPGLMAGWEALRQTRLGESDGGHVIRARARKVRIATTPRRRVETDGSVVGRTPVAVRILPAALTVLVPR